MLRIRQVEKASEQKFVNSVITPLSALTPSQGLSDQQVHRQAHRLQAAVGEEAHQVAGEQAAVGDCHDM